MKIYKIRGDYDHFDGCGVDYDAVGDKWVFAPHTSPMNSASTEPYGDTWWPRPIEKYGSKKKKIGDFVPSIGNNILVMNKFAIDALKDIMGSFEILPLECDFGEYSGVHILNFADCIDYDKSEFNMFSSNCYLPNGHPRVMNFTKQVFIAENIAGKHIFKDIDQPWIIPYVDELFVETVKKNNITGFSFELLWES
ncbi:MAG: hypothetical protein IKU19_02850 [Clostridia bacterium]|nr:hypothetical protein [Clostridia bacterium]